MTRDDLKQYHRRRRVYIDWQAVGVFVLVLSAIIGVTLIILGIIHHNDQASADHTHQVQTRLDHCTHHAKNVDACYAVVNANH